MDYNINELLEEIKKNKEEQKSVVQGMMEARRVYEASMEVLKEQYIGTAKNIDRLGNIKFPVRLGDLIDEIGWLSNTSTKDIQVSMCGHITLDGVYNMNSFLKFVGNVAKFDIQFKLSNRDETDINEISSFNYTNPLLFDLNSIQADGKTLLEHCSVVIRNRNGKKYTEFVIDKDIDDVILPFTLNYISLESSANWLPADLFTQAVINSVERYKENNKTLKRLKVTE